MIFLHPRGLIETLPRESYRFSRDFGSFRVVTESGDERREFFSEGDFSRAVFEELGLPIPTLVGTNRQATQPYLSSLLPIFYVRQIGGYDEPYRAPLQFISDQFVEMVRFAFGLGPKRSYTAQKDLLSARDQLEANQRRVVYQQKVVADLTTRIDDSPGTRERLEANASRAEAQVTVLEARLIEEEAERAAIAAKVEQKNGAAANGQLVSAVQSLTRELLETEQRLAAIAQLGEEKRKYLQFEGEREKTQDRIALLSNRGRQDFEFNSLRTKVQELTVKWMDILRTPNASREVEIDLDFRFRFGKQTIDVFNGSTRSRIILSIHAALFELYLQAPERPFRFLVLDTPKQQELASEDLARYLHALEDGSCHPATSFRRKFIIFVPN